MAVEQCPTMLWTTGSGTPALAESDTKVCRRLWNDAKTLLRLRPCIRTDIVMFAAVNIFRSPSSNLQFLCTYSSAIVGLTKVMDEGCGIGVEEDATGAMGSSRPTAASHVPRPMSSLIPSFNSAMSDG